MLKLLLFFLGWIERLAFIYNSTGTPFNCNYDEIWQVFHLAYGRTRIHPKEIRS
ncbi:MAG: hypothetical protein KME22_26555 [Hassallia sp. WJT32-NPBG1]|nr:hypothetical protein [Hassallia sp. WJT32-NPBG1]